MAPHQQISLCYVNLICLLQFRATLTRFATTQNMLSKPQVKPAAPRRVALATVWFTGLRIPEYGEETVSACWPMRLNAPDEARLGVTSCVAEPPNR
jgi:hypothetical protein